MKGYLNSAPLEGSDRGQTGLPPPPEEETPTIQSGMPAEGMPEDEEEGEEGTNVTKQQQEAYDKVVLMAKAIMYAEDTNKEVIATLKGKAQDPVVAVTELATDLIVQIDEKSKGKVPEEVIIPAGVEVAADLLELGEESGIFQEVTDEDKAAMVQEVVAALLEEYGETPESIQLELENLQRSNPDLATVLEGLQGAGNGQPA